MKILYLSDSILPSRKANSVHVMKMCEAFSKSGIETTLLAAKINDSIEKIYTKYSINKPFKIYGNKIFNRFLLFVNLIYVFKTIIKINPDVLYSRSIFSSLANLFFNKPLYLEIHKKPSDLSLFNKVAFRILIKLNSTKSIIVISKKLQELLIKETNIDLNKTLVLHDGATIENYSNRLDDKKVNYQSKKLKVGYVGSIGRGRGIELINELSIQLSKNFEFFIVGGIKDDLQNIGIENPSANLNCLGYLSYHKASLQLEQFDILLAPYNDDLKLSSGTNTIEYMSPLKVFEYMAKGKPIIVSDLPVLREILSDDIVLFANAHDKNEWISSLNELMDDKLREKLGFNALSLLEKEFTWDVRVKKILNYINRN